MRECEKAWVEQEEGWLNRLDEFVDGFLVGGVLFLKGGIVGIVLIVLAGVVVGFENIFSS